MTNSQGGCCDQCWKNLKHSEHCSCKGEGVSAARCVNLDCPCHHTPVQEEWEEELREILCGRDSRSLVTFIRENRTSLLRRLEEEGKTFQLEIAQWIDDTVDNHRVIKNEGTRDRVKILMIATVTKMQEKFGSLITNLKKDQ